MDSPRYSSAGSSTTRSGDGAGPTSLTEPRGIYDNLLGQREFRLVRLSQSSAESQFSFELKTVDPEEDPIYTALSYVWGSPEPLYAVQLNGQTVTVGGSLWLFLNEVAEANAKEWFFIDAVCINQHDRDERASQVKLMGLIYRNAQEVRIWVPTLVQPLWRSRWQVWQFWKPHHERVKFLGQDRSTSNMSIFMEEYECATGSDQARAWRTRLIECFQLCIAYCDYWTRLWVVQEILLAKKLTFQWRSLLLDWDEVIDGINSSIVTEVAADLLGVSLSHQPIAKLLIVYIGPEIHVLSNVSVSTDHRMGTPGSPRPARWQAPTATHSFGGLRHSGLFRDPRQDIWPLIGRAYSREHRL